MSVYTGVVGSITPSLTDDNWILSAGATEMARVLRFWWGGEVTTSQQMATRVARASGYSGALTTGNVAKHNPNAGTNLVSFGTTYATTQPTLDAGDLFRQSWNAHGGTVMWAALRPEEELLLVGATTETIIVCRNSVGTQTSTYGVTWSE